MKPEYIQSLDKLREDVNQFLKTGEQKLHQSILEQLGLEGNDISYMVVERLLDYLDFINDTNTQIFLANGIKQIVKMNYSIFSTEEKKNIYQRTFNIYKKMPQNSYFFQDLIICIFKFFYDSIQVEVSFIEDVKSFSEQSAEHLQLGLLLFSNIINCMQDYQIKYKCSSDLAYIDYNSDLSQFHRKKEISFRQNLLPIIFDIPFQLLNTKKEDLMVEQETNFQVLLEVLNLLYNCLNYDYFDQKKVSDEKFIVESSILSIPCREKKQDNYINDLKSQEFTSILFELYYFMVNKHREISIRCLQILSLLCRLSIKFFKKEDQKFSQMIFIIDGLHKIYQTHTFIFEESDVFEQTQDIFQAFCLCVSKIPIGISFSDGENLVGFWEFVVEVNNITKVAIDRKNIPCLELLLEFWCGYYYFLSHDGAQKQDQLRSLVEKILKEFIKSQLEISSNLKDDQDFEEAIEEYSVCIKYFGQLSNAWIDQIEDILMKKIYAIFQKRSQTINISIRNSNRSNYQQSLFYQLYWMLLLLFKAQSYNIKEELQTTNKHYELDSQDEIKEDLEILHQAFDSFGKLFKIGLNLFKSQDTEPLPYFLQNLILEIAHFLIDYILAFKSNINFDYLNIIIKFTDSLELKNYFFLNNIINYFLDELCFSANNKNSEQFLKILKSISSNLQATDQGVQIGCFPYDLQGFFDSETFKRHKENSYNYLDAKKVQKIYEYLFVIVDRHEQYKKIIIENDLLKLTEQLTLQQIDCNKQQKVSSIRNSLKQQENGSKQNSVVQSKRESYVNTSPQYRSQMQNSRKSEDSQSKKLNQVDDDIVEIVSPNPIQQNENTNLNISRNSLEKKKSIKLLQESNIIDYFNIFMNVISSRIQLDNEIPIGEQKNILKSVLNQLIGIVKSSTIHTYSRIVQFILQNNIFYSIKQVIKQEGELNHEEINCSLKFISEISQTRIYLISDLQELLLKEEIEIIIATQDRLLNKSFIQNVKSQTDEWNLVILPLSYQYRIIFNLLQQQMLNFSQLDSQMIISNMFHCLTVITPEKMSQYHKKLYWIYRSIHLLSQLHFEVFLFLQPLEFHSVTQIMEEALKVSFDSEEPMEFFINVLNQIFICKKSNNLIMNQYLAYSEETLIKVLQAIVLKVIRNEDLNQKNLYRLMLGYFWMLEKDKFLQTVNQVFSSFPYQNTIFINKFENYTEEIEILDIKKYQYTDQAVLLDAKIIFKRVFG
ncbi:hypothetical protein TTHERM_00125350 (macronuclear) [Tetrahymena thermophila SB210]|uniref:Uncharacterized protein n=1 Tax=Tetrahymena thermophila (strain SB210) TaxID=312017 RepID=I7MEA7_TETTS|nr:hypothetical protein TTHERM_00125350 [Tetrahymena thermophila SB210]EAR95969.1 hypothetical protein TTHERM_00125350 [Tetrahymena thermophila SB210]|eukprot:XP_001016214.1 hypothetical protein TTHERM_00125350 [Tetrahymena thermophila SB210]